MKIGRKSYIGVGTIVLFPWRIQIGARSVINENCHLDGRGGLNIGADVSISIYSKIITATHMVHSDSFDYVKNPVTIEDKTWIGTSAIVLDGSILKEGCVLGAGSVLKGETNPFGIYLGNPAEYKKDRGISENFYHNTLASFYRL